MGGVGGTPLAEKLDLMRLTSTPRRKSPRLASRHQEPGLDSLKRILLPELDTVRECSERESISPAKSIGSINQLLSPLKAVIQPELSRQQSNIGTDV